jgi:hypothetical protein
LVGAALLAAGFMLGSRNGEIVGNVPMVAAEQPNVADNRQVEIDRLKAENAQLKTENANLASANTSHEAKVADLDELRRTLQAKLGMLTPVLKMDYVDRFHFVWSLWEATAAEKCEGKWVIDDNATNAGSLQSELQPLMLHADWGLEGLQQEPGRQIPPGITVNIGPGNESAFKCGTRLVDLLLNLKIVAASARQNVSNATLLRCENRCVEILVGEPTQ